METTGTNLVQGKSEIENNRVTLQSWLYKYHFQRLSHLSCYPVLENKKKQLGKRIQEGKFQFIRRPTVQVFKYEQSTEKSKPIVKTSKSIANNKKPKKKTLTNTKRAKEEHPFFALEDDDIGEEAVHRYENFFGHPNKLSKQQERVERERIENALGRYQPPAPPVPPLLPITNLDPETVKIPDKKKIKQLRHLLSKTASINEARNKKKAQEEKEQAKLKETPRVMPIKKEPTALELQMKSANKIIGEPKNFIKLKEKREQKAKEQKVTKDTLLENMKKTTIDNDILKMHIVNVNFDCSPEGSKYQQINSKENIDAFNDACSWYLRSDAVPILPFDENEVLPLMNGERPDWEKLPTASNNLLNIGNSINLNDINYYPGKAAVSSTLNGISRIDEIPSNPLFEGSQSPDLSPRFESSYQKSRRGGGNFANKKPLIDAAPHNFKPIVIQRNPRNGLC